MEAVFFADKHRESGQFIASFPATSVTEVIRCVECKYAYEDNGFSCCDRNCNHDGEHHLVEPWGFCAWAVRKDD